MTERERRDLLLALWAVPEAHDWNIDCGTDAFVAQAAMRGLSMQQMQVLLFLRQCHPTEYVSPTEVARGMFPKSGRCSAWASPKLLALKAKGLVERSHRGWYRLREVPDE